MTPPGAYQLIPVTDSSNIWMVDFGNPNLKETKDRLLTLNYERTGLRREKNSTLNVRITGGKKLNNIVDSLTATESGVYYRYYANATTNLFTGDISYRRTINTKNIAWTYRAGARANRESGSHYVNNVLLNSKTSNVGVILNLTSRIKNIVSLNLNTNGTYYITKNGHSAFVISNYKGSIFRSEGSLTLYLHKRITFTTTYQNNYWAINKTNTGNNNILNSSIYYRLFKKENAELKLTLIDALNQNQNTKITSNNNQISRETQNSLGRFAMITFSFYPRKF